MTVGDKYIVDRITGKLIPAAEYEALCEKRSKSKKTIVNNDLMNRYTKLKMEDPERYRELMISEGWVESGTGSWLKRVSKSNNDMSLSPVVSDDMPAFRAPDGIIYTSKSRMLKEMAAKGYQSLADYKSPEERQKDIDRSHQHYKQIREEKELARLKRAIYEGLESSDNYRRD